jgi:hypothetical protein
MSGSNVTLGPEEAVVPPLPVWLPVVPPEPVPVVAGVSLEQAATAPADAHRARRIHLEQFFMKSVLTSMGGGEERAGSQNVHPPRRSSP